MTTASNQFVTALAALVHELRPSWDARGIAWAAHKLRDTIPADALALAFIKGQADEANETPAALVHLDNRAWEDVTYPPCKTHPLVRGRRTNGECAGCYADRNASPTPGAITDRGGVPMPEQVRRQVAKALRKRTVEQQAGESA